MTSRKRKGREWVVHALLVAVLAFFICDRMGPAGTPPEATGVMVGDTLVAMADYFDTDMSAAIVLALSPTCPYCVKSLPFYDTVIDQRDSLGSDVGIIAVVDTSDFVGLQSQLLENEGVSIDSVAAISFGSAGIYGVPTVLHLDSGGIIRALWIGLLNEQRQNEVLDVVLSETNKQPI